MTRPVLVKSSHPLTGMVVRRRPTLPPRLQGSTIGAVGLSFRVRNGTGRFPFAMTAETLWRYQIRGHAAVAVAGMVCMFPFVSRELHSGRVNNQ